MPAIPLDKGNVQGASEASASRHAILAALPEEGTVEGGSVSFASSTLLARRYDPGPPACSSQRGAKVGKPECKVQEGRDPMSVQDAIPERTSGKRGVQRANDVVGSRQHAGSTASSSQRSASGTWPECKVREWVDPISEQDAIPETFSGKRGAQGASGTRPECKVQEWVDPISEQDAIPERFSGKRGAQRAKAFFGSG